MATLLNMLDDLNDRLGDPANAQATKPRKIAWLNAGIAAMWPKLYRTVRDATITVGAAYEYTLPATFAHTKVIRVEQDPTASGRFVDVFDVDIVPDLGDPVLVFRGEKPATGAKIRVVAAKKITDLVSDSDVYDGPPGSEELPVLYAMGIAAGRRLDDKSDHRRYAATQAPGIITPSDIMESSQFWFSQFELLLDRQALPLPSQGA